MSLPLAIQQYWQLHRILMFPLRGVRWMAMGVLGLVALGGVLWLLTGSQTPLMLAFLMALPVVMAVIITVPMQMLSLVSSKQFFWMPGLRNKTFSILLLLNGLITLLVILFLELKPNNLSMLNVSAMVFLMLSVISFFVLLSSVYFQKLQPFVFILIWGIGVLVFKYGHSYALLNFGLAILVWLCCYKWWCGWVPHKYFGNYFALSPEKMWQMNGFRSEGIGILRYQSSSAPRSLSGTLLTGASDGFTSKIGYELGQLLVIAGLLLVVIFFFPPTSKEHIFKILPFVLFTFVSARNSQIQLLCYRNLHRIWIYFEGSRSGLFGYLEKQYFLNMVIVCVELLLVLLAINFLFDGVSLHQEFLMFAIISGNLFGTLLFYLGWIIYRKTEANTVWLGWITGCSIAIAIIIIGLNSLSGAPNTGFSAYWVETVVILALTLLARHRVVKGWEKMNFYRVKN